MYRLMILFYVHLHISLHVYLFLRMFHPSPRRNLHLCIYAVSKCSSLCLSLGFVIPLQLSIVFIFPSQKHTCFDMGPG